MAMPDQRTAIFEKAVLMHRRASRELEHTIIINARRGASDQAAHEINQAGEHMAQRERDLLRLYQEALNTTEQEQDR